jgi:maleate isomerase
VTRIGLDTDSDSQFDLSAMLTAARLLADSNVDVIAWNGTSGSWMGPEMDRQLAEAIKSQTGIPATTSTLAYLDAFSHFDIESIGLITPYTQDVNQAVVDQFEARAVQTVGEIHFGLSDNESFARLGPTELSPGARQLAASGPDALVVLCTNVYGAPLAEQIEVDTGVPLLDSVAVTLWRTLTMAGVPGLERRWGRLLS